MQCIAWGVYMQYPSALLIQHYFHQTLFFPDAEILFHPKPSVCVGLNTNGKLFANLLAMVQEGQKGNTCGTGGESGGDSRLDIADWLAGHQEDAGNSMYQHRIRKMQHKAEIY